MAPISISHLHAYMSLLYHPNPSPSVNIHLEARTILSRATSPIQFGVGVTPPETIPNKFIFTLFGLIGASFVCTGVWFFCRAKNGGFYFKSTDWEDYKSSVLRRRGPNGSTISGATASTRLGGGSIYFKESKISKNKEAHKKKRSREHTKYNNQKSQVSSTTEETIGYPEMSEISDLRYESSYGSSDRWKSQKKKKKNKTSKISATSTTSGMETVNEEDDENSVDDLMAYRFEKPACVGGLNTESEASAFDGSAPSSSIVSSDVSTSRLHQPTKALKNLKNPRMAGIRKVTTVSNRHQKSSRRKTEESSQNKKSSILQKEDDIKIEAKRRRSKGREFQRREFSFRIGDDSSTVISSENSNTIDQTSRQLRNESRHTKRKSDQNPPNLISYTSTPVSRTVEPDLGTKSYHHPMPELSSTVTTSDYAEERRRRRNESRS